MSKKKKRVKKSSGCFKLVYVKHPTTAVDPEVVTAALNAAHTSFDDE